jgi:hypothetical protein
VIAAGNSHVWTYTYTIDIPDFTAACRWCVYRQLCADAIAPTHTVMQDACGNTITPVPGTTPSPLTCEGDMVYTFTYTDCAGKLACMDLYLYDRYS